ncbi:CDP-diacylglycerol--serine O-phosphatidyltransferase 1 [Zea mays]|nr:unknown [Zea mays]AQK74812.1 CDP-diacylglycerol--serine O-phosphatidyltransferase 1 [Zea mays]AQK74813.1 CDP-diacylglycerol--serine O-phosphatidyltransferase 1 [Zea mays]AQK74819.1 CDP-diacylglycerol--serine O-phosphatidyltransferase 1 [Zea mays]|eukprot:NP_001159326.1 uncharacterized protein LOC100304419 [Zea mays]
MPFHARKSRHPFHPWQSRSLCALPSMVADPYAPRFFPYAPSAPFHPWPRIPDVEIWELKLEISRMRVRLTADDGRRKNCGGRSSQCSDGKARRR